MSEPLLWHFPISHYNEKVRWALDYKRIPHRRKALSATYMPRAWWATGRGSLPVLHLDDGAVGDSTRIIAALEERWPEPALYPKDPVLRSRALEIEDWFDETVGTPVRTVLVGPLMTEGGADLTAEVMFQGMDVGGRRLLRALHPLFHRFYFLRHGVTDESRGTAPGIVLSGLDRVEAEVGEAGYLAGDEFSVADLSAASLLAPLARPEGSVWARIPAPPSDAGRFAAEIEGRPAIAWVRETYRRHRGDSSEVY